MLNLNYAKVLLIMLVAFVSLSCPADTDACLSPLTSARTIVEAAIQNAKEIQARKSWWQKFKTRKYLPVVAQVTIKMSQMTEELLDLFDILRTNRFSYWTSCLDLQRQNGTLVLELKASSCPSTIQNNPDADITLIRHPSPLRDAYEAQSAKRILRSFDALEASKLYSFYFSRLSPVRYFRGQLWSTDGEVAYFLTDNREYIGLRVAHMVEAKEVLTSIPSHSYQENAAAAEAAFKNFWAAKYIRQFSSLTYGYSMGGGEAPADPSSQSDAQAFKNRIGAQGWRELVEHNLDSALGGHSLAIFIRSPIPGIPGSPTVLLFFGAEQISKLSLDQNSFHVPGLSQAIPLSSIREVKVQRTELTNLGD